MKLTRMFPPEIEAQAAQTYPGMAHWAGSGPAGETCRTCRHHGPPVYSASGDLRPAPCARYQALTRKPGPKVPHGAAACRHHERAEKPPARFRPKSAPLVVYD